MKILRFFAIFCLFLMPICVFGCQEGQLDSANVEVMDGINFLYNDMRREICLGGYGTSLEYYQADVTKGVEAGYRVGLKFYAPAGIKSYETGVLTTKDKIVSAGEFYREVNGQKIGEVIVYLVFQKGEEEQQVNILWEDGTIEQSYKVRIQKGTRYE